MTAPFDDSQEAFFHPWHAVSWGLVVLGALCGFEGCGPDTRRDAAPDASAPATANGTADSDRTVTASRSSHPIDQTEEGAIYRQAVAALDRGDVESAMAARGRLEGHPQYGVLAEALDAIALVKQRKYEEALRAAEELSKIPALQAESCMIAGEVFQAQGKWGQAIGAFQKALELHPQLTRAHRWLGAIFHDTGAMQLATDHLRKVAELDSTDYRSLRLCGLIQYEYQKYDQAVDDYNRALQRSPPARVTTEIRVELADALRELRRVDEALDALSTCDDSPAVLVARATCLETGGKMDEALAAARHAVELAPRDPRANFVLGRVYLAQRQPRDAVGPLQTAVAADPTNHEPRFLLGRALIQTGQTTEGKAELERSTELKETFLQLAELHVQAIEKPYDIGIRIQLGEAAEKLGRPQIAVTWYRAALGLDPANEAAARAITRLTADAKQ